MDSRIGEKFLRPGPGFGGSCFPKDTQALVRIAQEYGVSSRIVETVIEVNEAQKARMIKKIREIEYRILNIYTGHSFTFKNLDFLHQPVLKSP